MDGRRTTHTRISGCLVAGKIVFFQKETAIGKNGATIATGRVGGEGRAPNGRVGGIAGPDRTSIEQSNALFKVGVVNGHVTLAVNGTAHTISKFRNQFTTVLGGGFGRARRTEGQKREEKSV